MTPERIAELQRLCDEASPGPWFNWFRKPEFDGDSGGFDFSCKPEDRILGETCQPNAEANRKFIIAARTAMPELLAALATIHDDAIEKAAKLVDGQDSTIENSNRVNFHGLGSMWAIAIRSLLTQSREKV